LFPTKEDVHGIKRQEVLREAAASFNFKGYHATSLTEIATSLGVTKAALYHYFPNKNSLLAACFERAMDVAFASLERGRRQGKSGRERLVLTITGYVSQLIDELNCCVVLMEEQARPYLANGRLVRVLEDWCEPFAGYFLYYPSRRQQPAALSALIDTLRLEGDRRK